MKRSILCLPVLPALLSALLSCSGAGDTNLALRKAAYASSSYDYNLTAQLVTDGIVETEEPAWLSVRTAAGELPRREKEWTLDEGPYSRNTLPGERNFLEYSWSRQRFGATSARIVGRVAFEQEAAAGGWSITCYAEGKQVGSLSASGRPGEPSGDVQVTDPDKQTEPVACPSRTFSLVIPLEGAGDFGTFKVAFAMAGAKSWEIYTVALRNGTEFGESTDTGPYASKEARGMNLLPSEAFRSAWMSLDDSPQWLYVDLGTVCKFSRIRLDWIHPASEVKLSVSDDAAHWKAIRKGGKGRYVRVEMSGADGSGHFALSELEVLGRARTAPAGETPWRLRRISEVSATGEEISTREYVDASWMPAVVPGTVLTSFIKAGAVPDPNFSDNIFQISDSYFNSDFWYRGVLKAPCGEGRRVFLDFDGVNWKAEVFFNGHALGRLEGAFKRGRFDVTSFVQEENVVAVRVLRPAHAGAVKEKEAADGDFNGGVLGADNPTFHASIGWDWIPTIRGRETGIWNDVRLCAAGPVTVHDPLVQTTLSFGKDTLASMTVTAVVKNVLQEAVGGLLEGWIGERKFGKEVMLAPSEEKTVVFTPAEFPQLKEQKMALWWPNDYGAPNLYDAGFVFRADGMPSDSLRYEAGIRQFTCSDVRTRLKMFINGHRFTPKGGNWGFSESNLQYTGKEYDLAVRNHRDQHFNIIRDWVGMIGDEEFYEACDRYGIVVWQDFWLANPADGPDPDDPQMFLDNARDYVARIRRHPSIGLYCGRNEGYPPKVIHDGLTACVGRLHGDIVYIPSSADDGVSGHGPYRALPVKEYFSLQNDKFHSERGMPDIMTPEGLRRTFGKDIPWPHNALWGQHDFTLRGAQAADPFMGMTEKALGERALRDGASFGTCAQWTNYNGYRAMYEANNVRRNGLLIWMSHGCWPSLTWQTYDYWFEPTAAYFGARKACEPLHIQYDELHDVVQVVNAGIGARKGLTALAEMFDARGRLVGTSSKEIGIPEDATLALPAPEYAGNRFLRLTLSDASGTVLSTNCYVLGEEDGNVQFVNELPAPQLEISGTLSAGGGVVTLVNRSEIPAVLVRLNLVDGAGEQVLPVTYSDNYFTLMGGETRRIAVACEPAAAGSLPKVQVTCLNRE